jgi:hypothetical protein
MVLKKADLQVTSFGTPITSACIAGISNDDGLVVIGYQDGSLCTNPPTTASVFAPGCLIFKKNGTSASTNILANTGTTASVTWSAWTVA